MIARLHVGRRVGRHFLLWPLFHWAFRGPAWHPIVFIGVVALVVAVVVGVYGRRGGPPRGPRRGGFF